jgi:hypothetical protein
MVKTETLGHLDEQSAQKHEYLTLSFSPSSGPLRVRWRNNGLSADFLGDYVKTFLPADAKGSDRRQAEILHAVTYVANEFLENAMKYHDGEIDVPIGIRLELTTDRITVHASNGINAEQARRYKAFIEYLSIHDAGELLVRQLEKSSSSPDKEYSCLGLVTMVCDYGVGLSWRFDVNANDSRVTTVTTTGVLPLRNDDGEIA